MSRTVKRFTETLLDIRGGEVITDLTEALADLVRRVNETGRPGDLTLKLKIRKASKGAGATLIVTDDIKTKMPVAEKGETVLFAGEDGNLQRNDPRQPRLALSQDKPANTVVDMTTRTAAPQADAPQEAAQ